MKKLFIILLYIFCGNVLIAQQKIVPKFEQKIFDDPKRYGDKLDTYFKTIETKKVDTKKQKGNIVVLENGYAQSKLKNSGDWLRMREAWQAATIDVVYTKYPKDKEFWLTDYHELLVKRLVELFRIDSTLNDKNIRWNLVLQTACETQEEARAMFHGVIIHYEKRKAVITTDKKPETQWTPMDRIERFFVEVGGIEDSFIYKTFSEHKSWKNALVVMDLTGSMYQYSPQVVLWHMKNSEVSGIKHFCYFNDGDKKAEVEKKIGETGGVYFEEANKPEKFTKLIYTVMRHGYGGETLDENDCEAIIKAEEHFAGQFDELILVADNTSIRDFELFEKIKHPIKVILVGCEYGINVQYVNLAFRTGGSLYTIADDLTDIMTKVDEGILKVGGNKYKLNRKTNLFECVDEELCEYQFKQEEDAENKTITSLKRSPLGKKMAKGVKGQKLSGKYKKKKKGFFARLFGGN